MEVIRLVYEKLVSLTNENTEQLDRTFKCSKYFTYTYLSGICAAL